MSLAEPIYDQIGIGYTKHRQADTRIVGILCSLLNLPLGSVIADIGAGTGNYSMALANKGYVVKAIEPSGAMRMQFLKNSRVEWIPSFAEDIPLENDSVDGVVVISALHHFASVKDSANEMYRICPSGPVVIFTHDPRESDKFWFSDYFPEALKQLYKLYPPVDIVAQNIVSGKDWSMEKVSFPLPHDLTDKFTAAGWRTPEMYLDPSIRQSMSPFVLTDAEVVRQRVKHLRNDLKSGEWNNNYGYIRQQCYLDAGYRFLRFISNENMDK